jgi:V/A-type H+-transporting ATPase subunit E
MNTDPQLEKLETAIRQRAQTLANTHLQAAQQQRAKILADSAKRSTRFEERETEMAKTAAEREYRRRVQAGEIKMQAQLDELRWELVQTVMVKLYEHLQHLSQQSGYLELLKQYFAHAARLIVDSELVVETNASDYALLLERWQEVVQECAPQQQCHLVKSSQPIMGGLLVRNQADSVRVDNTFTGIIARAESELYQIIAAQLLASATVENI